MLASLEPIESRRGVAQALASLTILAGCDRARPLAGVRGGRRRSASNERAYHPAPAVDAVVREGGRIVIAGRAQPGATVRLATPEGRVVSVIAGSDGRWRIELAPSSDLRLFGLSALDDGRAVQSEGYLAVALNLAAQLRAGAGALVYGAAADRPRILALDYDGKGGCVVSGVAAPGGAVSVRIDGAERGQARADASGRFSLALDEPVTFGSRTVEIIDGSHTSEAQVEMTPAIAMPAIPLRASRLDSGWRVDWTTPGGGLQTTLLFTPRLPTAGDPA